MKNDNFKPPKLKEMKKVITVLFAIIININANIAQTPYDDFAPSNSRREMLKLPEVKFRAYNVDSTNKVRIAELNTETLVLTLFSADNIIISSFQLTPTYYKWWTIDPKAEKYISSSPYNYVDGNPISRTDPDGADWYQDGNGNAQWFNNTSQGFSDANKVSWTNIGTEFLQFNGQQFTYSWQTSDKNGNLIVNSQSFGAVSGKPLNSGSYMDYNGFLVFEPASIYSFDYSTARQGKENIGPTPEGLYSINKTDFIEGLNEGGTQRFSDMSWYKQIASHVGRTNWPGGESSWGEYRWKLQFESVSTDRNDFYLHGGSTWGSRGCIDLGAGINSFYNSFMNMNLGNDKVYLQVNYPANYVLKIMNYPTSQPMIKK